MKNTNLFVWVLSLIMYVTSSYCMQGTNQETQLTITQEQQITYKKMCEWLEACDKEKKFVFEAVKAVDSHRLRWEKVEGIRLKGIGPASQVLDNPLSIEFEYLTCINMKLWSSGCRYLEPIMFLLLKQASQATNQILFVDRCTRSEKETIYEVKPMLLNRMIKDFLAGNSTGFLEQKMNGSKDEALFSLIQSIGFDYTKYLEEYANCIEQPQKRNYVQLIGKICLLAALAGMIYWAYFVNNG